MCLCSHVFPTLYLLLLYAPICFCPGPLSRPKTCQPGKNNFLPHTPSANAGNCRKCYCSIKPPRSACEQIALSSRDILNDHQTASLSGMHADLMWKSRRSLPSVVGSDSGCQRMRSANLLPCRPVAAERVFELDLMHSKQRASVDLLAGVFTSSVPF